MKAPRLLVVSHPCEVDVNRAVYRLLSRKYGVDLHLVIPVYARDRDACAPIDREPFRATILDLQGPHARLDRAPGLTDIIRREKPTHILVDAEAASMIVRDVGDAAEAVGSRVWVLSTENRTRHFIREGAAGLVQGRPALAVGGLLAWWLLRSARRRLDRVFTICDDGSAAMAHLGFAGRITKIPLGFDPELFYRQPPEAIGATRLRLGLQTRTLAYFGRLLPGKGVHLLIEALATMTDVPWTLLMDRFSVSYSPYESPYQAEVNALITRRGLRDRIVHFEATHREIADYMNAADLVVLPSLVTPTFKEQYGRVIPEAMACGAVVLASTSGALPELIGDAGFVFPAGDLAALTARLRELLTADAAGLEPVRRRAETRARGQFSIATQAEILYQHLSAA